MKRILTILAVAALAVVTPSCTLTPEQKAAILTHTQAGVDGAVAAGILKPGYSVFITSGVGLVTSLANPVAKPKEVPLEKLGLDTAVESGVVHVGDTVVIRETDTVVVTPASPPSLSLAVP